MPAPRNPHIPTASSSLLPATLCARAGSEPVFINRSWCIATGWAAFWQVLSPITGKVLGASELRVSADKESISQLEVHVVTGLSLAVIPDESTPGVFLAKTSTSHSLTSLYQVRRSPEVCLLISLPVNVK